MHGVENLYVLDAYWHSDGDVRTEVGELVHRAKDQGDSGAAVALAERFAGLAGVVGEPLDGAGRLVGAVPSGPVLGVSGQPTLAAILAEALAGAGAGQFRPDLLSRQRAAPLLRDTAPALRPSAAAALGYEAREPVAGRHVLLVDDVVLTGATLTEVAKRLKDAGAASIVAAVAARTRLR